MSKWRESASSEIHGWMKRTDFKDRYDYADWRKDEIVRRCVFVCIGPNWCGMNLNYVLSEAMGMASRPEMRKKFISYGCGYGDKVSRLNVWYDETYDELNLRMDVQNLGDGAAANKLDKVNVE